MRTSENQIYEPVADRFHWVTEDLAVWEAYDSGCKTQVTSCAHLINEQLFFVDPFRLEPFALEDLVRQGAPAAILLTNANHFRAAAWFRDQFRISILAHPAACRALGGLAAPFDAGLLPDQLSIISLPGGGPGEVAFFREDRLILSLGDAVIHLPGNWEGILPERYCEDQLKLRCSLGKILHCNAVLVTFAHGLPIFTEQGATLQEMINERNYQARMTI